MGDGGFLRGGDVSRSKRRLGGDRAAGDEKWADMVVKEAECGSSSRTLWGRDLRRGVSRAVVEQGD